MMRFSPERRLACRVASILLAATTVSAAPAGAQQQPRTASAPHAADAPASRSVAAAAAHATGFSPERLARIDSVYMDLVGRGEIAGAVALVLRDGRPVYERAFGWADREAGRRMTADAIFRIASQTKAITSVAILMLAEEGRLSLNDPVSRYIPAFRATTVSVQTDSGRITVPARRQVTIRDLLTHTAGISYGTDAVLGPLYEAQGLGPAAGFGWYTADKDEPVCETMERLATLPFAAHPGDRWVYGYSTDILGCVVERAAGVGLDTFFATRITGPLGMHDTHFFLPPGKADRLAVVYARAVDGTLVRSPAGPRGQGDYVTGPRRNFAGGAGVVSTARDYARFLQALLQGGELDGARVLAPASVALLTASQVGTLFSQQGEGHSLAFRTLDVPGARARPGSVGTYDWAGAYGSAYFVDPREGIVAVFMMQELPHTTRAAERFPMLVYQALLELR
jgi:CubicO group peptidase (beta-lactamase class C family)